MMSHFDSEEVEQVEETDEVNVSETEQDNTYLDFDKPETLKPDNVRARINKDYRLIKEAEAKAETERKAREELEAKLLEKERPAEVQPPESELWLDNVEEAQKQNEKYIAYVRENIEWERKQSDRAAAIEKESASAYEKRLRNWMQKTEKAGIDVDAASAAGTRLGKHVSPIMGGYIADHPYGPQLVMKLDSLEPLALKEFLGLNQHEAVVKIEEMAKSFHKKVTTNAPEPDDPITGSGSTITDESKAMGIKYS